MALGLSIIGCRALRRTHGAYTVKHRSALTAPGPPPDSPPDPPLAWRDRLLLGFQAMHDEHAAVPQSVDEVRALVAHSRANLVPSLVAALTDRLPRHAPHLDLALGTWLCKPH